MLGRPGPGVPAAARSERASCCRACRAPATLLAEQGDRLRTRALAVGGDREAHGALPSHHVASGVREEWHGMLGRRQVNPPGREQRAEKIHHPRLRAVAQEAERRQLGESEASRLLAVHPAKHLGDGQHPRPLTRPRHPGEGHPHEACGLVSRSRCRHPPHPARRGRHRCRSGRIRRAALARRRSTGG